MIPDDRYCLKRTLNPGRYPVLLSVANFVPVGDTRVACVMLKIREGSPVRWEAALVNEPNPDDGERYSYGVDSGTGFMDADVADMLAPLVWKQSGDPDQFEEFCDRVLADMAKHSFGKHRAGDWANISVNDQTGANVVVSLSGGEMEAMRRFGDLTNPGTLLVLSPTLPFSELFGRNNKSLDRSSGSAFLK